ncbi:MAG: DNA repair protein RecO [Balneolaceae bacterium]|nr:MAG: DNA repair protein RecO [Balneolaceae bacterium]
MIIKTDAIVLRTIDYSESSLIASLFTRNNGLVSVIAKGAKRPKSKFASFLVPGQVLESVFYYKSTRSIQTLSDVSFLVKLDALRHDVEKMAITVTTMELVNQVIHENEVNESLFDFLVKLLEWINGRPDVSRKYFPYIQTRIIHYIGIGLQVNEQIETKLPARGYMNIESGTLTNTAEGAHSLLLSEGQLIFLKAILLKNKSSIFENNLSKSELSELIEYLDRYIRYHVGSVKPRSSDSIFDQILNH